MWQWLKSFFVKPAPDSEWRVSSFPPLEQCPDTLPMLDTLPAALREYDD